MQELARLQQDIILIPSANAKKLSLDEAANCVVASSMVDPTKLAVGQLKGGRFLIILPEGLDRDKIIKLIPQWV
jgi:hypothetical protein